MPGPGITYPNTGPTWGSITGNPMYDATAGLFDAPGNPMKMLPSIGLWGPQLDPGAWAAYNQAYWTNPANHAGETVPANQAKQWNTPPPPPGNVYKKIGTGTTSQPPPPASGGSLPYSIVPGPFPTPYPSDKGQQTLAIRPYGTPPITSTGLPPTTQPAPTIPGALPGTNLGLSTGGVNPYLTDPLMASYYGMQNPNFQQPQQDFYGDPELYSAPSVGRATGGG